MTYSVKEIFYTLQGEGANTGRPAVFLRFAGCNLWSGREPDRSDAVCRFCDTEFVGTDGKLRPAADILAVLKGSGVEPDELRATYCQGGIRAALAWFALSEIAGLTHVRNYAESWEEWGNRPDLPIEK